MSVATIRRNRTNADAAEAADAAPVGTDETVVATDAAASDETAAVAPARLDLGALLSAAAERGLNPEQFTPEEILGLPAEEVARLRANARDEALGSEGMPMDVHQRWSRRGMTVDVSSAGDAYLLRRASTGRRSVRHRVVEALATAAAARGIKVILEELANADDAAPVTLPDRIRDSYLHLVVANPRRFDGSMRVGRRAVGRDVATPEVGSDERLVFINPSVVAQLDEDGRGARLFAHPFLNPQGELTSSDLDQRTETFGRILDAVVDAAPERDGAPSDSSSAEQQLRDAVATLDLIPGFVQVMGDQTESRREQLDRDIARKDAEVARLRAELTEAVRAKTQLAADRDALNDSAAAVSISRLSSALVQVNRIRGRIRAVRDITLDSHAGTPAIHVVLHPMVLEHGRSRYLCDQLAFKLPLAGSTSPVWDTVEYGRSSPHPHVSSSGSTCWGEAAVPVTQALERKDFAAAVMHIVGWASMYNNDSPYVHLSSGCQFPSTLLPAGWHPELPVRLPGSHD